MITLTPWAAAGLAFALLTAGATVGFFTAALMTVASRADDATDLAEMFRRGVDAGRAAAERERQETITE